MNAEANHKTRHEDSASMLPQLRIESPLNDTPFPIKHADRVSLNASNNDYENLESSQSLSSLDWNKLFKYQKIERLEYVGEGSGGTVAKCRIRGSNTVVAVKYIYLVRDSAQQKLITREVEFAKGCNSAYIVKLFGEFQNLRTGQIGLVMEYCDGGSLEMIYKHVRAKNRRIGERPFAEIAFSVLGGLCYLYGNKIIHRDIKPSNILLTRKGEIKLCDFGVSGELVDSIANTFTGTSYYMAPERIRGESYTQVSDVWSLGLVIMEGALNYFPLQCESGSILTPIELLTHIVQYPPPILLDEPEKCIQWTEAFRHFLKVALTPDQKKRPTPAQMLKHPWIIGHRTNFIDMAQWLHEVKS